MFNAAALVNLLGFVVGIALYGLLLMMVVRHRDEKDRTGFDTLLLLTAGLGLLWNAGELAALFWSDLGTSSVSPLLYVLSYSALGFLPSVVVHSAWKNDEGAEPRFRFLAYAAYALSFAAAAINFIKLINGDKIPSDLSLRVLSAGSLLLLAALLVITWRQRLANKTVWISALSVFALSALHLSDGQEETSWLVELVAHQSSVPLAIAILMQDFRFAFADLFLKRALSLMLLAAVAFGLYVFAAVPLLRWHETHDRNDVTAAVVVIALWMLTALLYPALHKFAVILVDKIILRRADFERLEAAIAAKLDKLEDVTAIMNVVCEELRFALTAREADWSEIGPEEYADRKLFVGVGSKLASVLVPTVEMPYFEITLREFAGGRRLLSDEIGMLESIGIVTARRIDALRVTEERYERKGREDKLAKYAAEAKLSALRAQINPHFLFNALTTIGYLIQTAPDKAFQTLMKLTQLLRGVLRSTEEFSSLGEEIKLIENYLDIEKTRFEERLAVSYDIPDDLRKLRIPSLILQPLVENAVKHGISEAKNGGEVGIGAEVRVEHDETFLYLEVSDTGAGFDNGNANGSGIGLDNIRQRLRSHYGREGTLKIESRRGNGTTAVIRMPVRVVLQT